MKSYAASICMVLATIPFLIWVPRAVADPPPSPDSDQTSPVPGSTAEQPESRPESPFAASGSFTFASRYLFQGNDYSEGKPVFNPQADVSAGPLSARLWVNHDLNQGVSNEFDLSLLHEWAIGKSSLTTGYTYLWYPHREGWAPSQELYLEFSREGVLNPALSVHYDFDAGEGTYSTFGLSHSVESRAGTVSLGANLFYQGHYYGASGFPSTEWNLHFEKSFSRMKVTPSVSRFVTWPNGDFRDENSVKSAWVFSFQVARAF